MSKFKDLTGKRFSRLVVLGINHKRGKPKYGTFYDCLCDCGDQTIVMSGNLTKKNTKSCGCYRREIATENLPRGINKKPYGYSEATIILGIYKTNAKRRNLEFLLTRNQFVSLIQQNCYYCGSVPNKVSKHKNTNGEFIYSGLDRIDNSKGYALDNVVPCCETCNRAKLAMTQEEFLIWINKVYHHQNGFDELDCDEQQEIGDGTAKWWRELVAEGLSTYGH